MSNLLENEKIWEYFAQNESLSGEQLDKFRKYFHYLDEWNKKFNLTAIENLEDVIKFHFVDSIVLRKFIDLTKIKIIADVGSGAGFPSIPLKILFPHLNLIIIEVSHKKRQFLQFLIEMLSLQNVEICELDWRTFLRTTEGQVDLFVSRATLDPEELSRALKPACPYNGSKIAYWAAETWEPGKKVMPFVKEVFPYKIRYKSRKIIVLSKLVG